MNRQKSTTRKPPEQAPTKCPECGSTNLIASISAYRDFRLDDTDGWCEELTLAQDETATVTCEVCNEEWSIDARLIEADARQGVAS